MPLYEYVCEDCRSEFELLVRGSQPPLCPNCGGKRLEKLLSVPAAHTSSGSSPLPLCEGPASGPPGGPCGMGGCGLPECG
ncbi:MAG: zinc ribbon domain-containing protein [Planctomycetales bacterium]|nr:zinc ribbon domain-containing protein [Planctomycetales bacterium]